VKEVVDHGSETTPLSKCNIVAVGFGVSNQLDQLNIQTVFKGDDDA